MATRVALQHIRPSRTGRAWAMACAALVVVAGAPALAQSAAAPQAAAAPTAPALNRAQIDALLASPDKVVVLDVRRADEISTIGGFPVFLNIQAADVEKFLAYIPRDRQIITVSNHAARAQRAALLLRTKGFRVAGAAGVQDYEAQGGTLVGKKPAATATAAAPTAAAH